MSIKKKNRDAALKAWKTIRKNRREAAAKNVKKLENWISAKEIDKISHPEKIRVDSSNEWKGNDVINLFNKTPDDTNIKIPRYNRIRGILTQFYCHFQDPSLLSRH